MMRAIYEAYLVDLRREIEVGGARPTAIDMAIEELASIGDERLPADLLSLLSDEADYDEGMFSLIHAAEASDDQHYTAALLSIFRDLMASSPRWASIVLMRMLNNASSRAELVRQLRSASPLAKEAVRVMCERINAVSPEFLSKTVSVTVAASD